MIYDKKSISCTQNFTVTQHSECMSNAASTVDLPASHLLATSVSQLLRAVDRRICCMSDLMLHVPFLILNKE